MKILCLAAALFLSLFHINSAHAQYKSDSPGIDRYSEHSTSAMQWRQQPEYSYSIGEEFGVGAAFDEDGAVGISAIFSGFMMDIMLNVPEDGNGLKMKGGYAVTLTGDRDLNLNIYGMAGYGSFTDYSGPEDVTNTGILVEGGTIIGLGSVGLGVGYMLVDDALEETYFTFRGVLYFGY